MVSPSQRFISFCLICGDDTEDLKQTLLLNLKENEDYNSFEILILDCSSTRETATWVKSALQAFIDSGKVVYYRKAGRKFISSSHAKNVLLKLAKGEIVCYLDCNQLMGFGFAGYINECFRDRSDIVITAIDNFKTLPDYDPPVNASSRICALKSSLLEVSGFDEKMKKKGFENEDIIFRLSLIGVKAKLLDDFYFLLYIPSSNNRAAKEFENDITALYVRHLTPASSEVIVFYSNALAEMGTLVENSRLNSEIYLQSFLPTESSLRIYLDQHRWLEGTWRESASSDSIAIMQTDGAKVRLDFVPRKEALKDAAANKIYHKVTDTQIINFIAKFNLSIYNKNIMIRNFEENRIRVNGASFGSLECFRNFAVDKMDVI